MNKLAEAEIIEFHSNNESDESKPITEQQLTIIKLMRGGDSKAKQNAIAKHMDLVFDVAKGYENTGVPIFELIIEGCFGLIHSLETFDLEGRVPFLNYARLNIRESIEKVINIQHDPEQFSVWHAYQQANVNALLQGIIFFKSLRS